MHNSMPELQSYHKREVPREIAIQITSGIRFIWPQLMGGLTKLVATPRALAERRTFVLMDGELLASHAEANIREVEHQGERYRVGGLSAVFTYPSHRGSGAGERVVTAATEFLRQSDADFALLFCGERVSGLYKRVGWEQLDRVRIDFGDKQNPQTYRDGLLMGMFLSQRARTARSQLEGSPLYVGPNTW
jgi:predicted acetyltransferase